MSGMKDFAYFSEWARDIVKVWEMPDPNPADPTEEVDPDNKPLWFRDALSRSFFCISLANALYQAYRMGVCDERKRRKRSLARRHARMAVEAQSEEA